jgi:hypothetical protein
MDSRRFDSIGIQGAGTRLEWLAELGLGSIGSQSWDMARLVRGEDGTRLAWRKECRKGNCNFLVKLLANSIDR